MAAKTVKWTRRRPWLQFLVAMTSLPLLVIAGTAGTIWLYSFNSDPTPSDAAVVLGAAVWGQKPSPVFEERIRHAVTLYEAGQVDAIIFTGGLGQGDSVTEAQAARSYALDRGIPAQDIFTDEMSTTTYENLLFAKAIADKAHFKRLLIVSDPLHMKRALIMALDLGMDAHPSPTPTSKYTGLQTQASFLARETYFFLTYLVRKVLEIPIEPGQTGLDTIRQLQWALTPPNTRLQATRPSRSASLRATDERLNRNVGPPNHRSPQTCKKTGSKELETV